MDKVRVLTVLGLGAVVVAAATPRTTPARSGQAASTGTSGFGLAGVGTSGVVLAGGSGAKPAPNAPVPIINPAMPAPSPASVPAGPTWTGEPASTTKSTAQLVDAVASFLLVHQPAHWATRPTDRRYFAAALVAVAQREKYPLDLLIGHCWAEGALKPYMVPTKGSGAYGPLQVSKITCVDVGMSYPPASVATALTAGIKYMRLLARRHSLVSVNDTLLCYGLGYGGFRDFQKYGCSGKPCERPQSVWRHECGCSGAANRYRWKVNAMTKKAAQAGLHTYPWANWRGY